MNHKITFSANFGNFDYGIEAQVSDEMLILFAGLGLGQVAQRTPCTDAEKSMIGASWPKNKKGEPSRPKGFERSSIEYRADYAEILRESLETLRNESGAKVEEIFVTVSERQDKVESKWAAEKALITGKQGDATRLAKLAEKVGFYHEGASELTVENVGFCQAIRTFQKELLAREMAD